MTDLERQIRTMIESATEGEKGALLVLLEAAVEAAVEARSTIDTLKVLLREAAPKCTHCNNVAIWTEDGQNGRYCLFHVSPLSEPFELGRQIKAALGGGGSAMNKPLVELVAEMTAEIVKRDATIDTLKALLREAAPKCEKCGAIATYTWPWPGRYKCYKHRIETIAEPFELGRQIVKALEE